MIYWYYGLYPVFNNGREKSLGINEGLYYINVLIYNNIAVQ
jgi:hypothetical protein